MFADALVDALVVAAQDDDVLLEGELIGYALGEDFSVGGHVDDFVVVALCLELAYAVEHGLHHHDHAGISAIGVVVYGLAAAEAVFAEVVYVYLCQALLDGPAGDGVTERAVQKLWNHGYDVNSEHSGRFVMQK